MSPVAMASILMRVEEGQRGRLLLDLEVDHLQRLVGGVDRRGAGALEVAGRSGQPRGEPRVEVAGAR